ncbi:hypothetical protein RvY_13452 [Ramazzottius varieornatus]|uniref:Uncharacterized protein n=1 Tax=Ramazzottius varieornatus TaxID=947166 RepID=A0A1D1VPR0_RAMVA|nr:hypothetical protein RvY_13452 [Ramazzottius varieornatus]
MGIRVQKVKQYKLTVVGDAACGKTCLLSVFANNVFPEDHIPTVFETFLADVDVAGEKIQLYLWDTAGQEDFDKLRPFSYPDTDVILLVFAIDDPQSLTNATTKWMPEVVEYCPDVPVILVGTKRDLRKDEEATFERKPRTVTTQYAKSRADAMKVKAYMECSAKHREGVREIFDTAARFAMRRNHDRSSTVCHCCGCSIT